ncbi:LPS assembly lipoprotein LptE [Microbulbifer marinus]|uniref:LPS-assembly lipoprotein LptE n=1 Tax=Microbulbifer marinus TaxID=658218 RepID=A0A1H3X9P5_9GAMM|nr:LPS assembly lipoprotein LptE [Microbulbifer marinus]SDZ95288.1 Outer membrane lipoprotein LptE/RlpB (LPS assembly) [Microbulbifer marinus]
MTKIFSKPFIYFITAVLLSGCGWHLRGAPKNFPPGSQLYISAEDPRSNIAEELTRLLQNAGLPMAESPLEADYDLTIHKETERKRTVSVDAQGRAAEYELITSALYSVRDSSGRTLLNNAQADVYRSLEWSSAEIVSKGEEERLLREEMRRELISRIIDRLRRIDVNAPPEEKSY